MKTLDIILTCGGKVAARTLVLHAMRSARCGKCHAFSGARRSFAKRGAFQEPTPRYLVLLGGELCNRYYSKTYVLCQVLCASLVWEKFCKGKRGASARVERRVWQYLT